VLAPVQQTRQDYAGAEQMFESATTLLKSIGDLPSLVTTLRSMHNLHIQQGKTELAQKSQQYMQRKEEDLQSRLDEVRKSAENAQVVAAGRRLVSGK